MTIFYKLDNSLYINITNSCPCACVFCIRNTTDSVGDAASLWLEKEPTLEEIFTAFDNIDLDMISEIVFCGYGEPMTRPFDVIEIARYIKAKANLKIRLNTNGLVYFISPSFDISQLEIIDSVSVSLNADDEDEYLRLVCPTFGIFSYDALLQFVKDVRKYTSVRLTVMEDLGAKRIDNCRKIAQTLDVGFRVREYS